MKRLLLAVTAVLALACLAAAAQAAAAAGVVWQRDLDGRLHGGDAFTSVVAASGRVYAAGYTAASWARRSDMLLASYTADGRQLWVRRWNGPASGGDQCWALARDRRGGLCLAGSTAGHGGDAALVRYTSGGRLVWSRRYDSGSAWRDDARIVLSLAKADGVYVVVESRRDAQYVTRILRYTLSGKRVWTAKLPAGTRATAAVTDAGDDLYVSGWSPSVAGSEWMVSSWSPSGALRWSRRGSGDAPFAAATSIADAGDRVAWTLDQAGSAEAPGQGLVLASSSTSFSPLWQAAPDTAFASELTAVAAGPGGGVVAVGSRLVDGVSQGLALPVDQAGAAAAPLVWSDAAGCEGDLVAPAGGGWWIAGETGAVFSVLRLVPDAGITWRYDCTTQPAGRALALVPAPDGGAYVAGWTRALGAGADAFLLRVSP